MIIVRAYRISLQIQVRSICASGHAIGHQVGIEPNSRHIHGWISAADFRSLGEACTNFQVWGS